MAPSVAIPTLDPLTVHAPEREAAERRAEEDAARALALLLEHGVLGHESLSVCVM